MTRKSLIALMGATLLLATASVQAQCLPVTLPGVGLATRPVSYWFTHAYTNVDGFATLEQAIYFNGGTLKLGFMCLPQNYIYAGGDTNLNTLMEAVGLYRHSTATTGDGKTASSLCQARKQMAAELIAALANNILLGTTPSNINVVAGYQFPNNLIDQAGVAAAGYDSGQIVTLTALLHKFNNWGVSRTITNIVPEMKKPNTTAFLNSISIDPTAYATCPGINDSCETAEVIVFPASSNPFATLKFQKSVDLRKYPSGAAFWQVYPVAGSQLRHYTLTTKGSNIKTAVNWTTNGLAKTQIWQTYTNIFWQLNSSRSITFTNGTANGVNNLRWYSEDLTIQAWYYADANAVIAPVYWLSTNKLNNPYNVWYGFSTDAITNNISVYAVDMTNSVVNCTDSYTQPVGAFHLSNGSRLIQTNFFQPLGTNFVNNTTNVFTIFGSEIVPGGLPVLGKIQFTLTVP